LQRVGNCVPGLPFEIGNGRFCNFQLGKSSLQLFFQIDNQLGGITLRFLEYRFEEADAIRRYNGEGDGSNIHDEQNVQQNTNFPRHRNAKNWWENNGRTAFRIRKSAKAARKEKGHEPPLHSEPHQRPNTPTSVHVPSGTRNEKLRELNIGDIWSGNLTLARIWLSDLVDFYEFMPLSWREKMMINTASLILSKRNNTVKVITAKNHAMPINSLLERTTG